MTYKVLARKWRPQTFEQLVGQDHITKALSHSLGTQTLAHAYLFSGTRGVGKTTVARIFAKSLNCEQGVSSTPCGQCQSCLDVDAGCHPDLIEVDAASRTKVEDTRELLDNVVYAPSVGRYKIYLIDEVHMLSGHSFNALLKTLEEPPEHVIFLLATTDPQKLPITVLSRCLQYHLKPISHALLQGQLAYVLEQENISFEESALEALAHGASGSMRDGLSLLEQAIQVGQGQVTLDSVDEMLGHRFHSFISPLLKAILAQDAHQAMTQIQLIHEQGADFEAVGDALLGVFHAWSIAAALNHQVERMAQFSNTPKEWVELGQTTSAEQIHLFYQMMLKGKQELALAPTLRMGFEVLIIRLIHFRPFESSEISAVPVKTVSHGQAPTLAAKEPVSAKESVAPSLKTPSQPPSIKQAHKEASPQERMAPPEPAPLAPLVDEPMGASHTPDWSNIAPKLALVGLAKVLVQNCVIGAWQLPNVQLILDDRQAACLNDNRIKKIEQALSEHLGKPVILKITSGEVGNQSPLKQEQVKAQQAQDEAHEKLNQDENAQHLIKAFDASVQKVELVDDEQQEVK